MAKRMRFSSTVVFALCAVLGVTLFGGMPSRAAQSITATGQIVNVVITNTSIRNADGMTFASGTITGDFVGAVTGSWTGQITQGIGFFTPGGGGSSGLLAVPEQLRGTFTCVCSVNGVGSGTLTFNFNGGFNPPSGLLRGTLTILQGTGDLASLQGQGTFAADGSYSLNLTVP